MHGTTCTPPHLEITKRHLGLDHPELGQVPAGVAVLRAEGGAKSVDVCEAARKVLALQLP
jgi:hypothetical protein